MDAGKQMTEAGGDWSIAGRNFLLEGRRALICIWK